MQKNVNSQDEIDLLDVLVRLYTILKKNILLVIMLPLLGMITAFFLGRGLAAYTVSEMMLTTSLLTKPEGEFLLDQLERSDSIPGLSATPPGSIVSLSHEVEDEETDEIPKTIFITLEVKVTDPEVLPRLQQVIFAYLDSSEPVVRKKKDYEMFFTSVIKKIDQDLDSLERLKKMSGRASNPAASRTSTESVLLYEKKLSHERSLKNIQRISVVQGFTNFPRNVSRKMSHVLLIGFFGGAGLVVLILFVRFFRNYYKQHHTQVG